MKPVIVSLEDLMMRNVDYNIIEKAFGKNSLGLIVIKDIPDLSKLRNNLIKSGRKVVSLKNIEDYSHKQSNYAVGWSCGKEKMKNNVPDFAKGSYYANPIHDNPSNNQELIDKYPGSYTPNIWPKEVPEFEENFKELGQTMYIIGLLVLMYCDLYLEREFDMKINLEDLMKKSETCKGRFLHYFPLKKDKNKEDDASCGWHCDSGGLTGLISAKYFDKEGNEIKPKDGGLHIKDRNNNFVKVDIPEDCIAFQIGEILQILSGNKLIATPHCVKSTSMENVSRNTLAVFMDTDPLFKVKVPEGMESEIDEIITIKNLPEGVPKLKDRFHNGMPYAEFLDKTYKSYYS